ncbi:MAG TPA: hypothetical protein V6C69_20535 [Trichormus sp.]|jgi:hypothetical protein
MFAPNLDSQSIRIGELLVLSGALDSGDVVEAVTVSRRLAMPIGRVLIVSGCISEDLLEASLQAQVLVWEGSISIELAETALKLVVSNRVPLHEALGELHWDANFGTDNASLVELLLESEIVSRAQLELAMRVDSPDVVPLTSALVLNGLLSPKFFPMIGQIQQKLRSNTISRADAANELRSAYRLWLRAEHSVERQADAERESASDKVFRKAGAQSNPVDTLTVGDVTYGDGMAANASEFVFEVKAVTEVYKASDALVVEDAEVVGRLEVVDAPNGPVEIIDAVSAAPSSFKPERSPRLIDLLVASKRVDMNRVQEAFDKVMDDPQLSAEILMALGVLDQGTCNTALQYHDLVTQGLAGKTEAVLALKTQATPTAAQLQATSKRRSGFKRALTAAVVGGIAAVAVLSRKR